MHSSSWHYTAVMAFLTLRNNQLNADVNIKCFYHEWILACALWAWLYCEQRLVRILPNVYVMYLQPPEKPRCTLNILAYFRHFCRVELLTSCSRGGQAQENCLPSGKVPPQQSNPILHWPPPCVPVAGVLTKSLLVGNANTVLAATAKKKTNERICMFSEKKNEVTMRHQAEGKYACAHPLLSHNAETDAHWTDTVRRTCASALHSSGS